MESNNVREMPLNHNQMTIVAARLAKERAKENYIQRLKGKLVPRSYYEQHIGKTRIAKVLSYLLNAFFVSVAVYCSSTLTTFDTTEGWIILVAALAIFGFVETGKRMAADKLFDDLFKLRHFSAWLLAGCLACFAVSAGFGIWGVIRANEALSAPDPTLVSYQNQITENKFEISKIEKQIEEIKTSPENRVKGGNDKGKLTWNASKQVTQLTGALTELRTQTTTLSGKTAGKTKYFEQGYEQGIKRQGIALGGLFFGLEAALMLLVAWISYFDFRVLGETNPQQLIAYLKSFIQSKNPDLERQINETLKNFQ